MQGRHKPAIGEAGFAYCKVCRSPGVGKDKGSLGQFPPWADGPGTWSRPYEFFSLYGKLLDSARWKASCLRWTEGGPDEARKRIRQSSYKHTRSTVLSGAISRYGGPLRVSEGAGNRPRRTDDLGH